MTGRGADDVVAEGSIHPNLYDPLAEADSVRDAERVSLTVGRQIEMVESVRTAGPPTGRFDHLSMKSFVRVVPRDVPDRCRVDGKQRVGIFVNAFERSSVVRTGPLRLTESWKYALVGGLLALPFTTLEVWRSPENMRLGAFVVGSMLAGYLIKRRGGSSTTTGLRSALIGGFPALWILPEALWAAADVPNPLWFQAASIVTALAFGGLVLILLAAVGALAGRFGGWLAEWRGHSGVGEVGGSA